METNVATDRDYESQVLLYQARDAMAKARENKLKKLAFQGDADTYLLSLPLPGMMI